MADAPGTRGRAAPSRLPGAVAGEAVGTFLLVFFGTGAILATQGQDLVAIALAFGFAVLIAIYAFGHVSGTHINPAVTLALAAVGKFPARAIAPYLAAQFVGGILASIAALVIFGGDAADGPLALGATAPGEGVSDATAFLVEVIITFLLVVVVMGTATDERAVTPAVGLGVGLTVAAGILATGPISGASFNPVRSLAPMIVSGQFPAWFAYVAGPIVGALIGAALYEFVLRRGAPPAREGAVEEQDADR